VLGARRHEFETQMYDLFTELGSLHIKGLHFLLIRNFLSSRKNEVASHTYDIVKYSMQVLFILPFCLLLTALSRQGQ
jgi:hypothetical protein